MRRFVDASPSCTKVNGEGLPRGAMGTVWRKRPGAPSGCRSTRRIDRSDRKTRPGHHILEHGGGGERAIRLDSYRDGSATGFEMQGGYTAQTLSYIAYVNRRGRSLRNDDCTADPPWLAQRRRLNPGTGEACVEQTFDNITAVITEGKDAGASA